MLIKLSWRNIWRNKRRSQIVVISIIVGVVAIVLMDTLSMGMIRQMLENQIGSHVGHIQIHRNGFNDNKIIQNYLPDAEKVEEVLKSIPDVIAFSERVLTLGLLSSASNSSGVFLVGIHPEEEQDITTIKGSIVKGEYLSGREREIVIGEKLGEKLGVELGDKVVAMASALDGTIGSDVFRIVGLYQTLSSEFDKTYIYIPIQNSQKMMGLSGDVSEYVFLVENTKEVQDVKAFIKSRLGEKYEVLSYRDLLPTLVMYMDLYKQTIWIFYLIIAIAMVFGIVNTMLMSVFERIQEFGVLMAMGMKNGKLFNMILLEAFFLGLFGTIIGVLIGLIIYYPLTQTGIDFSTFSEGLTAMGSGAIIFPILTFQGFLSALVIVPFVSVIGAIYPAIRTVRLQPVSAIRYV
jgi:ABC-type lipoprotein release transport system permease subunit